MTVMLTFLGVSALSFVGLVAYLVYEAKKRMSREVEE